ncbi:MAG: TonB-dependent receptor [Gemmatimonadetes bacterium]|nr:TonB-dependent receptor [Gemmatimonadota bacterium]
MSRSASLARARLAGLALWCVGTPAAAQSPMTSPPAAPAAHAATPGAGGLRVLVARDAATGAPLGDVRVRTPDGDTRTDDKGVTHLRATAGDTLRLTHVGHAPLVLVAGVQDTLTAVMRDRVSLLPVVATTADAAPPARAGGTRTALAAREAAQPTVAALVATMPGVASRSARGEATWQLRGARAEQVLVTLDGVPLNDPASGAADAADLPLAMIARVRVIPGADGAAGGGAIGGTIALESSTAPVLALTSGAFGMRSLEGATAGTVGGMRLRAGGAWRASDGDYPFINSDGAAGSDTTERRTNNDERRLALFAALTGDAWHVSAMASTSERGLPGPMNVRSAEGDRARADRAMVRVGVGGGNWTLAAGVRTLRMRYVNLAAPTLDTDARTVSPEAEAAIALGGVAWRAGAGADRLDGTGLASATRARGFLSGERGWTLAGWRGTAGVRVDAIDGAGAMASPWIAAEGTGRIALYARVAQAFRAPTLYDLYFSAPQRLSARALRPERTTLDAELGLRAHLADDGVRFTASAFSRTVDDAIIWFPGNFTWSPSNVGRERADGLEASVEVDFSPLTLSAWGSATRATLDAGGLTLPTPYVPVGAGGLATQVATVAGTWSAAVRVIGARSFTAAPASAETQLPPTGLLDLAWSRRFTIAGTPALVATGLANALDARWESVRRFPSPGRAWNLSLTLSP